MSVKKIENFNIHEQPESNTDSFGVEAYLNANWEKTKEAVNNNAEELIQAQKDIDANKNDIENINSKNKSQDDTIEALKAENKLIKEQIPSANISGNSIYIEDSSNLDFDWKIKGGHAQTRTTQPENYIDDREARGKTILEATSLYLPIINLKAGSGYYFKIFDSNDKIKNDSRYLAVEFYDINKTKIQSDALGYPNTFTEENTNKIKFAKIYYNKNDTDKAIGSIVIKKIGLKITSSASADDIDMFVPDSPSPDYPSEIETVKDNVKINAINKNFINMQKKTTSWSGAKVTVENNKITFVGASDGSLGLNFSSYESKIKMSKGNKITYSSKYVSGSYTSGNTYYNLKLIYQDGTSTVIYMDRNVRTYKNNISKTIILEKDVVAYQINGSGYTISGLTNELVYEFQLEIGDSASEIVEQSSQTVIMLIQQEMLTGDYIDDVEHHEWGKIESYNGEIITTDYISTTGELTTGATVYYKLAEPIDLKLTSEQKAVRNQKLYTYKNITNISLSDELASIDVEYKKDQDTINKNYENRLAALEAASIS